MGCKNNILLPKPRRRSTLFWLGKQNRMDEPKTPESANREDLIKAIDFEIEWVADERKRPGWTEWAIYGGFAVVFWGLVTFPDWASISLSAAAQILLTILFFYQSLAAFRSIYDAQKNENSAWATFHRESYRISQRRQFAAVVIQIFTLVIAIAGAQGVSWLPVMTVIVWTIALIVFNVKLFISGFQDRPTLQFRDQAANAAVSLILGYVAASIFVLVTLWAALGYLLAAIHDSSAAALANQFKLAGLVFAIVFLFEKLFHETIPHRVLSGLLELRRTVFFGETDEKKAMYLLKRLLGRLSPQEFIDGASAVYREALDHYEWTIGKAAEWREISKLAVPETMDGLQGAQLVEWVKNNSIRTFGSEESLKVRREIAETEGKAFDKDLKRAKRFLTFELTEFAIVEKEMALRKERIAEKLERLRGEQVRPAGDDNNTSKN
jgi:hypothetical protein